MNGEVEKTIEQLKKQDWLDINDIMTAEKCSKSKARMKITQARKWLRDNHEKEYPLNYISAEDYFNHIWLVPLPKIKKDTEKAPVGADA